MYRKQLMQGKMVILLFAALLIGKVLQAQLFDAEFKRLLDQAVEKSDTLQLNALRIRQVKLDEQSTRFNYLPRISSNATYTRLNADLVFPSNTQTLLTGAQRLLIKEAAGIPFTTSLPATVKLQPVPPVQEKNILKLSANTQWLLFSGFKVENGVRAFQHQQKALSYGNDRHKAKLAIELSALYDQLALLRAADSVMSRSANVLKEQNRFVTTAIKNGLATPLERKKIELVLQKLELRKAENESNRIVLLEKLQQLTGAGYTFLQQLQPVLEPMLLAGDNIQKERPEISALNEAITASRFKEKAERSEYFPKLLAFGQYEFREEDLSLMDPKWYAGLRLQWNLFDGFTARNNARKAALERKSFEVQKQAAAELLQLGRAKARQEWIMAGQRIRMLQAQESLAAETLGFVTKQYRNGLTTMTELLNALNDLEKAGFDLQQAFYEQRRAGLQLLDTNGTLADQL
ncbi:MAG: TolC family protein [Chitinophagales bacterium]|nr:TolC family protein [Chitinophagales bacterium]